MTMIQLVKALSDREAELMKHKRSEDNMEVEKV